MSSLSGLPLRQDIAVTGSVDQRGMIQPVGGINTKIEGFFKACQLKGLNGTQGMIIPKDNVKNLMLGDEILEAVRENMFHIYVVSTIEQGLQILTGKDPGKISSDGSFQPDTIHFLVNQKLRDYASVVASYEKEKDQYL
jgi:predicted ATP-dependent protease